MEDCMLDIESASTSQNAAILSIGACKFDLTFGITHKFHVKVNLQSCIKKGLDVDGDTIYWWFKQSEEARKDVMKNNIDLKDALKQFKDWLGADKANIRVWGNGSDFDNAILNNAFRKYGVISPWNYGMNRCFRTIKASFPKIELPDEGTKHNALDDAIYQAKYLIKLVEKNKLHSILS